MRRANVYGACVSGLDFARFTHDAVGITGELLFFAIFAATGSVVEAVAAIRQVAPRLGRTSRYSAAGENLRGVLGGDCGKPEYYVRAASRKGEVGGWRAGAGWDLHNRVRGADDSSEESGEQKSGTGSAQFLTSAPRIVLAGDYQLPPRVSPPLRVQADHHVWAVMLLVTLRMLPSAMPT
jgi:hypothetical protein